VEEVKDKVSYGSMKSLYVYISSHFSCSSAAFCNITQTGGGNQGQGELSLWFHGVVWCCGAMLLLPYLSFLYLSDAFDRLTSPYVVVGADDDDSVLRT
jgi:hypothetical protein